MYIDSIDIDNFRVFKKTHIDFVHPDRDYNAELPEPQLSNINLILGDNGCGKSTLLKAVALSALGPAVGPSGIYPYRLVRRPPSVFGKHGEVRQVQRLESTLSAIFTPHPQDRTDLITKVESLIRIVRRGDLEELQWAHKEEKLWHPVFSDESDAFFVVGYGSTRRVEKNEVLDLAGRDSNAFSRARRVKSLFEDAYSLIPLNAWLPKYQESKSERYDQVVALIDGLLGRGHFKFTGIVEKGEYLYERGGLRVPFPALSDGYRAYLGWVGDLLYHVCITCPRGKHLVDNCGIVMVDEIDLHLHPKWQMTILRRLAKQLPRVQFILTSHSPLLVGSLEWMNIIAMRPQKNQACTASRIESAIHGLDADQVLLTDLFGLETTRADVKDREMRRLTLKARGGDNDAAMQLLRVWSRGLEEVRE